ncbi:MarR family transcriptional regulator, partial [Streptomyces sp. NPDC004728]
LSGENGGQVRWVTRTFWSRTAHDNEWWNAFLTAEERDAAPQEATEAAAATTPEVLASVPVPAQPLVTTVPQQRTADPEPEPVLMPDTVPVPVPELKVTDGCPSPAFLALAHLGRTDSRLALSAADCAALEQMAAEWFARGVDADYLTHALTAGLPASVDSPFGFVRRRLRDKLPPRLPAASPAVQGTPVRRLMVECTECGAPGRPEAFRDGLCRPCREPDPA